MLLSLTLCGCWQDKCYSEDDYKRNYEDGFYAGVDAANKADAACLLDGPGSGIGTASRSTGGVTARTAGSDGAAVAVAVQAPIGAEAVEHARLALVRELGPIAKVMLRKALAEARSPQHLHELLAQQLDDPAQRARLLDALRRRPG